MKDLNVEALLEAMNKDNLVIFIGAGVSANSNLPSCSGLVKEFAAGLGLNREINSDDYLRIPQYYFNQRGMNEYFQKIQDVFNVRVTPNIIHERLLELKPKHIITTNYDDLIEQAIEKHLLFYDVICEDSDLPYSSSGRMLIKMHGDLKKRNIVLKEDDYLNYSSNFKLIESYIKSIFINHTVLFVGYSLQDYDLKLIIKSLQGILGEHFQKAYLIDSNGKPKSNVEKEYFKYLGVNIISFSDLPEDYKSIVVDDLRNEQGKNIVRILKYISKYDSLMYNTLDFFHNKLLTFENLQKIRLKDLISILGLKGNYSLEKDGTLRVHTQDSKNRLLDLLLKLRLIQENYEKQKYDVKEKYKVINLALSKSSLSKIEVINKNDTTTFFEIDKTYRNNEPSLVNNLLSNNFIEIQLLAEQDYKPINEFNNKYANELMRAYANYLVNKFVTAYEILKKISIEAYRDKNYSAFYIIEFNKRFLIKKIKRIDRSIFKNDIGEEVYADHIAKIIKEYESSNIEIEEAFELLSLKEKESILFLHDLIQEQGYIIQQLNTVKKLKDKVIEEVSTDFMGMDPTSGALKDIIADAYEFWDYSNYNFIMLDHYSEVKEYYYNYVTSLFSTYINENESMERTEEDNPFFISEYANKMPKYKFNIKDINIMCRYLSWKEVIELLNKYSIEELDIEIPSVVIKGLLVNLIHSHRRVRYVRTIREILKSLLVFLGKVKIDQNDFEEIISSLIALSSSTYFEDEIYHTVLRFIENQKRFDNLTNKTVTDLMKAFIKKLLNIEYNRKAGGFEISALVQYNYILFLANKIDQENEINLFDIDIESIIESIKFGELKPNSKIVVSRVLIPIFDFISDTGKEYIQKFALFLLEDNFSIELYVELLIKNILKPSERFEGQMNSKMTSIINESKGPIRRFPDPIKQNLLLISKLVYYKKILNKEKLKNFTGISDFFDFLIMDNFDFHRNFNLNWLLFLNSEEIENLLAESEVKAILQSKFMEEMVQKDLSKELKEVFFKYFINP